MGTNSRVTSVRLSVDALAKFKKLKEMRYERSLSSFVERVIHEFHSYAFFEDELEFVRADKLRGRDE